jgi:hypothetical protein
MMQYTPHLPTTEVLHTFRPSQRVAFRAAAYVRTLPDRFATGPGSAL